MPQMVDIGRSKRSEKQSKKKHKGKTAQYLTPQSSTHTIQPRPIDDDIPQYHPNHSENPSRSSSLDRSLIVLWINSQRKDIASDAWDQEEKQSFGGSKGVLNPGDENEDHEGISDVVNEIQVNKDSTQQSVNLSAVYFRTL